MKNPPSAARPLAEPRKTLTHFTRHQCRTWSIPPVVVAAEAVWIGRIPNPESGGWVQIRTQANYGHGDDVATGSSSMWMLDRGWVEVLPLAPYPDAPMYATADVSYQQRVEAANELVLLATVAFLRTTVGFR